MSLLVNGGPDTGYSNMDGWTITASGGEGWDQREDNFMTSYSWCTREQLVHLVNYFSAYALDAGVRLDVGEQVRGRYANDLFFINVDVCVDAACDSIVTSWGIGSYNSPSTTISTSDWVSYNRTFDADETRGAR